ncbi:RNA-directed DNA polymerase, eukaryota, partial [Tanacetum coccineum]
YSLSGSIFGAVAGEAVQSHLPLEAFLPVAGVFSSASLPFGLVIPIVMRQEALEWGIRIRTPLSQSILVVVSSLRGHAFVKDGEVTRTSRKLHIALFDHNGDWRASHGNRTSRMIYLPYTVYVQSSEMALARLSLPCFFCLTWGGNNCRIFQLVFCDRSWHTSHVFWFPCKDIEVSLQGAQHSRRSYQSADYDRYFLLWLPSSSPFRYSTWLSIIREIHSLKDRGVDLVSHCRIHVGNGLRTNFWKEVWIGDNPLCVLFPRIFALETNKDSSVAVKLSSVTSSLRRPVRDVRNLLDDVFLPKAPIATRWIKYVPIKLNVFAWKVHLNRLPTRVNLQHRGVLVSDPSCPICHSEDEDLAHLFFRCSLVTDIVRLVCRWWNIAWASIDSYSNWLHWFNAIRLSPKVKDLLEGVFYITWWSIWRFRNQVLFSSLVPRKDVLFDDIVSRSFTWCRSRCKKNTEMRRKNADKQQQKDPNKGRRRVVDRYRFSREIRKEVDEEEQANTDSAAERFEQRQTAAKSHKYRDEREQIRQTTINNRQQIHTDNIKFKQTEYSTDSDRIADSRFPGIWDKPEQNQTVVEQDKTRRMQSQM